MMMLSGIQQFVIGVTVAAWVVSFSNAYPVLVQVDENSERCVRFNIPEEDDAHLVALVIPNQEEIENDAIEAFYVDQIYKLTKQKGKHQVLQRNIPDEAPDAVAQAMSDYLQATKSDQSGLKVKVTGTPSSNPTSFQHHYNTKYFIPTVLNYVGRTTDARARKPRPGSQDYRTGSDHLEGYGMCLQNTDTERQVQVIFDIVLTSEVIEDPEEAAAKDDEGSEGGFEKEKHLTPLESSLEQSISAANSVLREMRYMERRESRMRKTAESINTRVRWFSYLSVSVLLSVTYIQVTYLKRYFHKKKLM